MDKERDKLLEALWQDMQQNRQIDAVAAVCHPDRDTIRQLTEDLRSLVFPGYSGIGKDRHGLQVLSQRLADSLSQQIGCLLGDAARGEALCMEFLQKIPQVRATVQTDLQAAFEGDPAAQSMEEIIISYPGLYAITVYRLAHELHSLGVPMLPRMMTEYAHNRTGIDIHPGAKIGAYFFIDHGTGIVIGETTVIGQRVKIYQGVTLGGLSTRGGQSLRGKKRHPTIEDDVTIYANASILGGDTVIGKGCVIGASAFVTSPVAPGMTVTIKNQELQYKTQNR